MKLRIFLPIALLLTSISQNTFADDIDKKAKKKYWKANVEAGGTISQGNSKEKSIYAKGNLDYKKEKWTNLFKTRLENTKVNDVRAKERYDVNNQLRYNFSKKNFRVSEFEYINDRYAGFNYRISESYGFGRNLIETKKLSLSTQVTAGLRQMKFTTGEKENTWLVRSSTHYDWKINKSTTLIESLDISFDKDQVITKSDTSLRIALEEIANSLYLQLGYFIEHRSSAPSSDVKKTDSTFMFMVGYGF